MQCSLIIKPLFLSQLTQLTPDIPVAGSSKLGVFKAWHCDTVGSPSDKIKTNVSSSVWENHPTAPIEKLFLKTGKVIN